MRNPTRRLSLSTTLFAAWLALTGSASAAEAPPEAVREILTTVRITTSGQRSCASCHNPASAEGSARFTDILDLTELKEAGIVRPGKPDASPLYQALVTPGRRRMPLGGEALGRKELDTVREWIAAGAPSATSASAARRGTLTDRAVRDLVVADLMKLPLEKRKVTRYLSAAHLGRARLAADVAVVRPAMAKVLNSLSWKPKIAVPRAIDPEGTVLAISLDDYGWTPETWEKIVAESPYVEGSDQRAPCCDEQALSGTRTPIVRADWLAFAVSRAPLYYDILGLPATEGELEEKTLGIDVAANVAAGKVARIGIGDSEVAFGKNRVLERHGISQGSAWRGERWSGAFWKSHDFASNAGLQNVFEHPLDFRPTGSEIIFSLPNGLQAYFVANGAGERLNEAPVHVVQDPLRRRSGYGVLTATSCMRCHAAGLRRRVDEVLAHVASSTTGFQPQEIATIRALYVDEKKSTPLFEADEKRFADALASAGAAVSGADPVWQLAKRFEDDMPLELVASELDTTPEAFRELLAAQPSLARRLGALRAGVPIDRQRFLREYSQLVARLAGDIAPPPVAAGYRWFASMRNAAHFPLARFPGTVPRERYRFHVKGIERASGFPAVLRDGTIVVRGAGNSLLWLKEGAGEKFRVALAAVAIGITARADDSLVVTTEENGIYWVKDGRVLHTFPLIFQASFIPALTSDGTAVVGTDRQVLWLRDGRLVHSFRLEQGAYHEPAILPDDIVVISDFRRTYWLKDGREIFRKDGPTTQTVMLRDGTLILIGDQLEWLDRANKVRFSFPSENKLLVMESPNVLSDGTIFFATLLNTIHWFKDGRRVFDGQVDARVLPFTTAFADDTVVAVTEDGSVIWLKEGQEIHRVALRAATMAAPVILPDGTVVAGAGSHYVWLR